MSPAPRPWTSLTAAEKKAAALPLLKKGLGYSAIADRLGATSRNSIAGIATYLRKEGKLPPAAPRKASTPRSRKTKATDPKPKAAPQRKPATFQLAGWRGANNPHPNDFAARAEQRAASPGITISRAAAFDPLPGVEPIGIMDLDATTCRWPLEIEKPGHFYCGAPCEVERTYCDLHSELATTGQTLRRIRIPAHA